MPVNRLQRDQLIRRGLDMADISAVDRRDRPHGAIVDDAMSIDWLQDALDLLHQEFPWMSNITIATGTIASGVLRVTDFAPADFILDVRNGLAIDIGGGTIRLERTSLQDVVSRQMRHDLGGNPTTGEPRAYIFRSRDLWLNVTTQASFNYTLFYYQMPTVLAAQTVPTFVSDWVLIEFIRMRAKEFANALPAGSAIQYIRDVEIPKLRDAGLGQEPEDHLIPLDRLRFHGHGAHLPSWHWLEPILGRD